MIPFARFLAFEAIGWLIAGALLTWLARAEYVPVWVAVLLFVVWVVKDFALYPLTRRAYEDGHTHGSAELLGSEVRIESELSPDGYVQAGGERWLARVAAGGPASMRAGERARVCALDGLTLIVEPIESPPVDG
jgi:membrane protein implicated in regulation of membrane protease activity